MRGLRARVAALALTPALVLAIAGCAGATPSDASGAASQETESAAAGQQVETQQPEGEGSVQGYGSEEDGEMRVSIGGTDVSVAWEDNQAVADLKAIAVEGPITVELSRYGGFEQVGPLGTSLTTSDVRMTTEPGDIVLYAGNQISVFYGPNSWAYTKLGHITDRTADELAELLGNDDASITFTVI